MVDFIFSPQDHILLCFLLALLLLPFSHSSDPDPLQDFCVANLTGTPSLNGFPCKPVSQTVPDDFFFDGLTKPGDTNNAFNVSVITGNVFSFPGLNTLGISMNRVDFGPGGINPLHSHPRSSETGIVIEGKLLVGFVSTDNVFYSKVLGPGQMFVVPRGLVHFQKNVGEGRALAFTAFNSHFPGAVVLPPTLFGTRPPIPNNVLTAAFQVEDGIINTLKSKFGG